MSDAINPIHYQKHPSGIQINELIRHMPFSLGNAFKYVARALHKHDDPLEDYNKSIWYVDDYHAHFLERLPNKPLWNSAALKLQETADKFFAHEPPNSVLRDIYKLAYNAHNAADIQTTQFKLQQLRRKVG